MLIEYAALSTDDDRLNFLQQNRPSGANRRILMQPLETNTWVGCNCGSWCHSVCVGIENSQRVPVDDDWKCLECISEDLEQQYRIIPPPRLTFNSRELVDVQMMSPALPSQPFAGTCDCLMAVHSGIPCVCICCVAHHKKACVHRAMFHRHWDRVELTEEFNDEDIFVSRGSLSMPSLSDRNLIDNTRGSGVIDAQPYIIAGPKASIISVDGQPIPMVLTPAQQQLFSQPLPTEPVIRVRAGRTSSRTLKIVGSDSKRGRTSLSTQEEEMMEQNVLREEEQVTLSVTTWCVFVSCLNSQRRRRANGNASTVDDMDILQRPSIRYALSSPLMAGHRNLENEMTLSFCSSACL